ncbi:MAG: rRNA pseudouridine synthase [Ruminococcaceae bacterium]|nr:rRNA pseudouridine synthase [Oscillospiraceae bacterium]
MEKMRLDKFLTSQNICSRKEAGILARKGEITVNGVICKNADIKIDAETAEVAVKGKSVFYKKYIYIMLNKPEGVVSAREDGACPTVVDILPDEYKRMSIAPAGRLDKNTTGLLIITDDGDFTHRMLSPKSGVYKVYEAELDGDITETDVKTFKNGIKTQTAEFLPAELWLPDADNKKVARVRICEGKFHQVKRMFAFCGKEVLKLRRFSIGSLHIDEKLAPGECRLLSAEETDLVFLDNLHKNA